MKKFYLTLAVGALSAVPLFAADPAPAAEAPKAEAPKAEAPKVDVWAKLPDVVATVDGKEVTKAQLIAFVNSKGGLPPEVTPEQVAQNAPRLVEYMVVGQLVEADYKANKPVVTKDQAREMLKDMFKKLPPQQQQMIVQSLKQQNKTVDQLIEEQIAKPELLDGLAQEKFEKEVIYKGCEVTDEEAKKHYDAHAAEFPEVVSASHILVQVKPDADEAAKKAALDKINRIAGEVKKNPAAFEEIAKKESDCPSKAQGGRLGEFQRNQMDPEFEKAAFALKQGEISGVVKSQFGYHVIRCDAAAKRVTFDMVKEDLKQILARPKMEQALKAYIDNVKKKHNVQILIKAPELPAPAQAAPGAPAAK